MANNYLSEEEIAALKKRGEEQAKRELEKRMKEHPEEFGYMTNYNGKTGDSAIQDRLNEAKKKSAESKKEKTSKTTSQDSLAKLKSVSTISPNNYMYQVNRDIEEFSSQVSAIQKDISKLETHGYYIDGHFGDSIKAAIEEYRETISGLVNYISEGMTPALTNVCRIRTNLDIIERFNKLGLGSTPVYPTKIQTEYGVPYLATEKYAPAYGLQTDYGVPYLATEKYAPAYGLQTDYGVPYLATQKYAPAYGLQTDYGVPYLATEKYAPAYSYDCQPAYGVTACPSNLSPEYIQKLIEQNKKLRKEIAEYETMPMRSSYRLTPSVETLYGVIPPTTVLKYAPYPSPIVTEQPAYGVKPPTAVLKYAPYPSPIVTEQPAYGVKPPTAVLKYAPYPSPIVTGQPAYGVKPPTAVCKYAPAPSASVQPAYGVQPITSLVAKYAPAPSVSYQPAYGVAPVVSYQPAYGVKPTVGLQTDYGVPYISPVPSVGLQTDYGVVYRPLPESEHNH